MAMRIGNPGESEAEVMVEMNTTPLIDVMLVLLVMLIITIPIQLHSVNLEMPSASAPPPLVEPQVVKIDITAAGHLLWNGELLPDRAALEARLAQAAAQADAPEIHLRPDRRAKYDTVAGVLAAGQRHGLGKVGLVGSEQFLP
ncbi:MAG: biopolymer transporter ExbD [Ramlibacter sp.]|jgi:biopolymer transport protein ExbD|nr:biopolymer transporter ExbD [Ramlibacter sp.]